MQSARLAVADEWAEQHEPADEARFHRGSECAGPSPHRVADDDRGLIKLLDKRENVAGGFSVAVGGERRVAVAVPAKVGAGDPVAGVADRRGEEAISRSEVTHAGHEHHEWPVAGDVLADAAFGAVQVDGSVGGCRADGAGRHRSIGGRSVPLATWGGASNDGAAFPRRALCSLCVLWDTLSSPLVAGRENVMSVPVEGSGSERVER